MKAIETDRLTIRNFYPDDWRDLQEMIVKYQESEYAQYDHPWPTGTEKIKDIAAWFAREDGYLAVCLRARDKLIGLITLHPGAAKGSVEFKLGYIFHAGYHGQGYATEGCRAVLDHAFGTLAASRVVSTTAAANAPSCQLLQRLGMQEVGQHTSSFQEAPDGRPVEFASLSFAISRQEWAARGGMSSG
jgi:RimJ/RimL family protein N-acetyltransferase